MEEPISFEVAKTRLFGILHTPKREGSGQRAKGILFRTAGLRYRTGPYRQYVRMARRFCENGYAVFRYDPPGIGDSEGSFRDMLDYRKRYAGNQDITRQVIDCFMSRAGISELGVFGLCSGAYDALLVGANMPAVRFAILLSLVVEQADGTIPAGMGDFDVKAGWDRFSEMANEALVTCVAQKKRMLFVYGDKDPFFRAFQGRFGKEIVANPRFSSLCEVNVVPNGDHVFSQLKWQDEAVGFVLKWLSRTEIGRIEDTLKVA